jgi:aryl-alcohol dehydrogenase-like predicted oxidoreductase
MPVSEMGFGAWAIGGTGKGFHYGDVPEADALACLGAYIEAGGNHIDTARYYNESERIIGSFLAGTGAREHVFLATKTFETTHDGIRRELDESLCLLRTDCVDLYYLHMPPEEPAEMHAALDVLEQLRDEGIIRVIGASIKGPDVTDSTVALCRQYIGTGRVDAIQVIYSIFRQKIGEVFAEAAENGVALVGRTCLESGFLTAKYKPGHQFPEGDHRSRWGRDRLDGALASAQELSETVVHPPYESLSQVAIRFAMAPDAICSTLVGAKSPKQVRPNLRALELPPLAHELLKGLARDYGHRTEEFNGS